MRHQKLFMIFVLLGSSLLVSFDFSGYAHAQTTITVLNRDNPGEGFNDASPADAASTAGGNTGSTLGEQRLIAFQFAANIWANIVQSNVEIKIGANFDPLECSGTSAVLGSAGPNTVHRDFDGAPQALTWYPQALANSIAKADLAPGFSDIGAIFNSTIGTTCPFPNFWYYGLDRDPPFGTTDFVTVVLHELGHGLGFLTFVDLISGMKFSGLDDTFMLNLEDHTTGVLYPDMTRDERRTASMNIGNLHWVGTNVIAASTGLTAGRHEPSGHVEMFAFVIPMPGSSVSHFSFSLSPDELMEPFFTGLDHQPGLAMALMKDIGWATPDPEAEALLVSRFRLYNPNAFNHFYTTDVNEYGVLGDSGWTQEGVSSRVYDGVATIESVDAVPYLRFYNPNTGVHFWTKDVNEGDALGARGWTQEGEDGFVFTSQVSGTEPLYRLYNPNNGLHFWTMDANERAVLIDSGFNNEGIACFVFPP